MKTMKTLVVIAAFGNKKNCSLEKIFDGKSSFDLCLDWTGGLDFEKQVAVFSDDDFDVSGDFEIVKDDASKWTAAFLCEKIASACEKNNCENAILTFADRPFNNIPLTKELLELHTTYKAEYTFADGYVSGIAPIVVNAQAAGIISALGNDVQKSAGSRLVSDILDTEGSNLCPIFYIIQGDINSFEIETVIAKKDYRMLRVDLSVSKKINRVACVNLWKEVSGADLGAISPEDFCDKIEKNVDILRTVPAFYNLQIASPDKKMSLSDAKNLFKKISDFSGEAVIGLSAFFDVTGVSPFENPDFSEIVKEALKYEDFKLFVECGGEDLKDPSTLRLCSGQAPLRMTERDAERIFFAVEIAPTAKSNDTEKIFSPEAQADFAEKIALLKKTFPNTYPQLTRTQLTEPYLENFYRYWSNKENESGGKIIIQKFNNYCGKIKNLKKTADLSPLDRNPCWHIRRDMTVLCDGRVPLCMQSGVPLGDSNATGAPDAKGDITNAFFDDLSSIWEKMKSETENHINEKYCDLCKDCDEYYTFNF